MAIGMMMQMPGMTATEYDKVMHELGDKIPSGALFHVAGPMGGDWCVVDVWESREVFERFVNEKLMPAFKKVGIKSSAEPKFFPVHNMLYERAKMMGR